MNVSIFTKHWGLKVEVVSINRISELKNFTVLNFRAKKISRISRQTDFWKIRENLFSRISRETDFLKFSQKQIFREFDKSESGKC